MTNAEIYRLIMNLIRFGIVEQVNLILDPPKARVRCGELLTDWLPWSVRRAGNARTWWPPTEGEQVIILAAGGELSAGVIIASLNQKSIPAPTTTANTQHTAYGSLLSDLIDDPQNPLLRLKAMSAAYSAIMRWEPRIVLTRVILTEPNAGKMTLELHGQRTDLADTFNLAIPIGGDA